MGKHFKESRFTKSIKKIGQRNTKMPFLQKCLLIVFILTFIISAIILFKWYVETSNSEKQYQQLSDDVNKDSESQEKDVSVDFGKLKEINSDVVGWIKINETNIDYPIVQKKDNDYYLNKNFYNKDDRTGAIFVDYKNKSDFTDINTVIYGHNIKRGTMFADLEDIYNGKLGKNVEINIETPTQHLKYIVFSSYNIEPEDYGINTSISSNNYLEFKENLAKKSKINFEQNIESQSNILTLSTCDRTGKRRILVHAQCVNGDGPF